MPKKIMIMLAVILGLTIAGSAMAAGPSTSLPPTSDTFKYSLSNDVTCSYDKDASAVNYVMNCKNKAGNRIFSGSNATSKLFYLEKDAAAPSGYTGATIFVAPAQTDAMGTSGAVDSDYTAWTAL